MPSTKQTYKHKSTMIHSFGCLVLLALTPVNLAGRDVIDLNGTWDIAQGSMDTIPKSFSHKVPVPGVVDMAKPAFKDVGVTSDRREAFWYRTTFTLDGYVPSVALLKIHKAKFGIRVYLNGRDVGEHLPCFTPALFYVQEYLQGNGNPNELVIRVGATRYSVPETVPMGGDGEKKTYLPGLYDDVELFLCGPAHLVRNQIIPDLPGKSVRVVSLVKNWGKSTNVSVKYEVRERLSNKVVASAKSAPVKIDSGWQHSFDTRIPMSVFRTWSPEDPFLYQLRVDTGSDVTDTRFGMRSFAFDKVTGRALLNGRPYYLRGTNVCIFRFFDDTERRDRPWRREWVRRLIRKCKGMHWNSMRLCLGFPPELWYEIADEEGFLIQDEYPFWWNQWYSDQLIIEFTEWMQERWNHPCVVIWDAQNESITPETGKAIRAVRSLDLSNRPWDNGWSPPQSPDDCIESHPYRFIQYGGRKPGPQGPLAELLSTPQLPDNGPSGKGPTRETFHHYPKIINEYGYIWLNRDGSPTVLTRKIYKNLLGEQATKAELKYMYARYLAALTEHWRCHRQCAGVMHFCVLGMSRPGIGRIPEAGATSDHWIDVEKLEFDPHFETYVKDAFAPVGLMIDKWDKAYAPGEFLNVPVVVINDLNLPWQGQVNLRLHKGDEVVKQTTLDCTVPQWGRKVLQFALTLPTEVASYQMVAVLTGSGQGPVRSIRDFDITSGND